MTAGRRIAALAALAAAVLAALFMGGAYDVSATDQHLAPTYWLLDTAMRRAVALRAKRIDLPPLDDRARVVRGARHFRDHCVQCHGAPGVAPEPFALGLTPTPANLAHAAKTTAPAELVWVIRHGLKMTGMPAWKHRLDDDAIWALVAFIRVLPTLSPQEYRASYGSVATSGASAVSAQALPSDGGDANRGREAIRQYACTTCHSVPGVVGQHAPVGPPLAGIATRAFIAGVVPNGRETMIAWLRSPQAFRPDGAMPDLGVSARDAADIAAYLATLR
jgi:mono/diheme cytochrome c family protein